MSHQPDVVPASVPCPVRKLLLYPALHRDPQTERVTKTYRFEVAMLSLLESQTVMSARIQLHCEKLAPALRHTLPLSTNLSLADV